MGEREERWGERGSEVMAMEEEKGEKRNGVGWERILRRMSVRVLLVEGDDSTRQIIAALLRKCSYIVTATSDGLKAWETLKEKHQNFDLVLTEVELPSISGFSLLRMIVAHETFQNIPVIMMSSHDSVSMVFKCMLKGAADFLVKPIRKNELSNLWQHVWRRQISSNGHGGYQDGSHAKRKFEAYPENGYHSIEYMASMLKNKEYSDQESDAQSSCTKSNMEAESAHMQNMLEHKKQKSRETSLDSELLMHVGEAKAAVTMNVDSVPTRCLNNNNNITNEIHGRNFDQDKPSKEVVDLNNQPQPNHAPRDVTAVQDGFSNIAESLGLENEIICKSGPMPHLGLSLRRYEDINLEKQANDEWNTLNHSNSSAFSLYHSKTRVPNSLTPTSFGPEYNESNNTSSKSQPDQGCSNVSDASHFNGLRPNMNLEDMKSPVAGLPSQDGKAVRCTPLRVIPFPIPADGMSFDSLCAGYGKVMQPMYYPQSAHPLWSTFPSTWQGAAVHTNSSHQSDQNNLESMHIDHPKNQSARSPTYYSEENQEETMELLDEQRHVSSATAESGSGSVCNGGRSHLNNSGGGSACNESTAHITVSNILKTTMESANHDGIFACEGTMPMDAHRLSQREAALNKFRMKRKDRCYEKKVRYQSRKLLAEQRPRVKGQFVRRFN